MATTIPVSDDTKKLYDKHKTDDFKNWDVFMQHVIETYESGGGESDTPPEVDTEELAEELKKTLASDLEVSAFRGAQDAVEEAIR